MESGETDAEGETQYFLCKYEYSKKLVFKVFLGNKSINGLVYFLALIPSYNAVLNFGASLQLQ